MVPPANSSKDQTAETAVFEFEGMFEGRRVNWQCQLSTLSYIASQGGQPQQRQFIEIHPPADNDSAPIPVLRISIGLDLPQIDQSAIDKTIIMIRNYRRLRIGRHEFGDQLIMGSE